jgi:hypothetical protein
MTQQTSLNGSAKKAIRLHEQAITGQQKKYTDIRRRLYQAIVVNIALGKLGTERSRQVQTGSFPP